MRASRLISEILLLQSRGRMTAQDLAAELEVSVRTIYRDVEALHSSGVPIYGDPGHDGGYRLVDGYRTKLTGLTRAEVEALFLAELPGPAAALGLGATAAAARLKVSTALPAELRDSADRLQRRFLLDTPGWYHDGDDVPHLGELAAALWDERAVEIVYRRWKEPTDVTRQLEPFGLVLKAGKWYVVARSGAEQIRTYRVAKILRLSVLGDEYTIPGGFRLDKWWRYHLSDFRERLVQGNATVRFSPAALARLPDLMSDAVVRAASAGTTDGDGWRRAVIPIESLTHTETELLRLGAEVEIVEPAQLRARFQRTAARLHSLYARRD